MQELTRSSQALQAMVMQVRMIPVEAVFMRFPRLVRDLSSKLGKQVELKLVGKETELDRTVVEALGDPLVHLVRNSLDHGLEPPEERVAAGKPTTGTLEISARHAGGNVVITVRDDGRGIDPAKVAQARRRARPDHRRGGRRARQPRRRRAALRRRASRPPRSRATSPAAASAWTPCATMIRELGGEVTLTSEPGAGTIAQIRLPLTLAIMSALLVEAGGLPFAIPLDRVERTLRLADQTVRSVAGQRMLVLRDGVLPLLDGASALGAPARATAPTHAVIVRGQDRRLALAVDPARRPARAGHPPAAARRRRPRRRLRRRRAVRRRHRPDRRLRRASTPPAPLARPVSPPEHGCPKGLEHHDHYSDLQLDALRELANIGSGTAGTALSQMLGRPVDISVPERARAAARRRRRGRRRRPSRRSPASRSRSSATWTPSCCCSSPGDDGATLCALLGVEAGTEDAISALGEIGNILGASYIALARRDDRPRARARRRRRRSPTCSRAIVASVLRAAARTAPTRR